MTQFHGFDANQAIVDFLITDGTCLPEPARNWVRDAIAGSDSLQAIVHTMETLYAYRDVCIEGHGLAHDLAMFVSQHNFYGMGGIDGRATRITSVMQRVAEGGAAVAEDDPERSADYAPQEPVEPMEPMPAPAPAPA